MISLCNGNVQTPEAAFSEERVKAVGCAVPLPELDRIWAAPSPPDYWCSQSHPAASCLHTVLPHSRVCVGCSFALTYRSALFSPKTFLSQTRVIPVNWVLLSHLQILWTIIHRENIYLVFPNLIFTPAKLPHPFQLLLMPMKVPLYHFGPFRQLKNVSDWAGLASLPTMTAYSNVS